MAKLLVVDDDKEMLNYLNSILVAEGHDVQGESSAAKAVTISSDYHPDLLISDIFMPDMDGFEFIKKIRKLDNDVKILAFSAGGKGFSQGQTLAAAKDFGANAVIAKPFEQQHLIKVINKLLDT